MFRYRCRSRSFVGCRSVASCPIGWRLGAGHRVGVWVRFPSAPIPPRARRPRIGRLESGAPIDHRGESTRARDNHAREREEGRAHAATATDAIRVVLDRMQVRTRFGHHRTAVRIQTSGHNRRHHSTSRDGSTRIHDDVSRSTRTRYDASGEEADAARRARPRAATSPVCALHPPRACADVDRVLSLRCATRMTLVIRVQDADHRVRGGDAREPSEARTRDATRRRRGGS
jgi:hypothetical protein